MSQRHSFSPLSLVLTYLFFSYLPCLSFPHFTKFSSVVYVSSVTYIFLSYSPFLEALLPCHVSQKGLGHISYL